MVGKTPLLSCGGVDLCLKGLKVARLVPRLCLNLAGRHLEGLEEEEDPVLLEEAVEDTEVSVLIQTHTHYYPNTPICTWTYIVIMYVYLPRIT